MLLNNLPKKNWTKKALFIGLFISKMDWYSWQRWLKTIWALYEYVAKNKNQVKFDMWELKDAMVWEYAF